MNIIIAGDGEVGFHLARILANENHNITVIDPHQDLLDRLGSNIDILTIAGDSTSLKKLKEANMENCDLLISVLHEEQNNLLTCIFGKKLGAKRTIARVNSPNFFEGTQHKFFADLGIDRFVCPERIAAKEIVSLLEETGAAEVFSFGENKLQLFLIRLTAEAKVIGKDLTQVSKENPNLNFRAVAIHRKHQGKSITIIPKGDDVFKINDLVYVIAKPEGASKVFNLSGKKDVNIKKVMIIGAGRIGKLAAQSLEKKKSVKIVDIDKDRCQIAAEDLESTLVIHGDATDISFLQEEGIHLTDAMVSVTNSAETNILTCLHAKQAGVFTTVALVENIEYIDIAQTVGIDIIINKKLITASYIARFTIEDAHIESLKVLSGVDAEVLEFIVKPKAKITKLPICQLNIPEGSIIGGIIRGEESFIAIGDFQIKENDRVVVFAEPYAIRKLSTFFI